MELDAIYERLTAIFRDVFDNGRLVPTAEMTAADVDEWDSLSHIHLVVAVEQTFGVRFATSEIDGLRNVGEFVDVLAAKL